jgi:hypothetical protein
MGLNGNVYGFTAPNVHGRRNQQAGHWLCQNLFDHYAFNQDHGYLEEIYPILKGAAEFLVEFLAPWKDGSLVVYPTWSPENCFLVRPHGKLKARNHVGGQEAAGIVDMSHEWFCRDDTRLPPGAVTSSLLVGGLKANNNSL